MARKLKVFRTAIGFHDAYVAAPSQKAALEAWGTDTNLFARGAAEIVTDEALLKEALANPGQVIKRSRGSVSEQLAALGTNKPKGKRPPSAAAPAEEASPSRRNVRRTTKRLAIPRPSRDNLNEAQRLLDDLLARQEAEEQSLRVRERALQKEREDLERAHGRDLRAAEKTVEKEREAHSAALERWMRNQGK